MWCLTVWFGWMFHSGRDTQLSWRFLVWNWMVGFWVKTKFLLYGILLKEGANEPQNSKCREMRCVAVWVGWMFHCKETGSCLAIFGLKSLSLSLYFSLSSYVQQWNSREVSKDTLKTANAGRCLVWLCGLVGFFILEETGSCLGILGLK